MDDEKLRSVESNPGAERAGQSRRRRARKATEWGVQPQWDRSGTGPTREQLSTRAGGRRCARSPLSASTRSFQLAGAGGGCAVATWPDNLDVERGKGDLVGRRASREKLRQP